MTIALVEVKYRGMSFTHIAHEWRQYFFTEHLKNGIYVYLLPQAVCYLV